MSGKKKIFIIDGSSLIYRAFHAIPPTLTSPSGLPTNAVYGFAQTLRKVIKEFSPEYLAVAFDMKGPTFRHEIFEEYKADRPPMPDILGEQIPYIKDLLRAMNIRVLELQSYEADDIIAAVVKRAREKGLKSYMITGDKDMYQLVGDDVVVFDYLKDRELDAGMVREKFGVGPEAVRDLLSLAGDASDGIPGVPGVGVKTAAKLLNEFGSLDGIYENLDRVKGKMRERLSEHRDSAFLSRELATLREDLPLKWTFDDLELRPPADRAPLIRLLGELGFQKILGEVLAEAGEGEGIEAGPAVMVVDEAPALTAVLGKAKKAGAVSITLQVTDEGFSGGLAGAGLSISPDEGIYVRISPDEGGLPGVSPGVSREAGERFLSTLLADKGIVKNTDSSKALWIHALRLGAPPASIGMDASLASYLIDPSRSDHTVEGLAFDLLGVVLPEKGKKGGVDEDAVAIKACNINRWAEKLEERLEADGLMGLYLEMELPLAGILAGMETAGIKVDAEKLEALSVEIESTLSSMEKEIYASAGCEFNINSPKQLSGVLFETLGMRPVKRTRTGYSTDEEVLTRLAAEHEVPGLILTYRQLVKLKSTYVDALLGLINPDTGRVHTSFNQTVTATGRLSSSRPNLQNIPIRGEMAGRIREAFVPEEGFTFLSADYSQIELRLVAHLSGDPALIEAFNKDEDIHTRTASEIFGISPEEVTGEHRRRAKAINFGIIYGMGPYGLSTELDISMGEAQTYIESYFAHYSAVKEFIDRTIAEAREKGYTTTLFGRRRYIPELSGSSESAVRFAERMAINTPVQGSAADIIKAAMIRIDQRLGKVSKGSRMILQIHDELVFEAVTGDLAPVTELVRREMEGAIELSVPIRVNIKSGRNWRSVE